jgi:hypothetical protein
MQASVSTSGRTLVALLQDGSVYTFGDNSRGQCAAGDRHGTKPVLAPRRYVLRVCACLFLFGLCVVWRHICVGMYVYIFGLCVVWRHIYVGMYVYIFGLSVAWRRI